MLSYKQDRKTKLAKVQRKSIGNNRKLTKAREKQRFGQFGITLPARITHFIFRVHNLINKHRANRKLIQKDLNEWKDPKDKKHALAFFRSLIREKKQNHSNNTQDAQQALKEFQTIQNVRAALGITKRNIALFLDDMGYYTSYSGKTKQMFVTPKKSDLPKKSFKEEVYSAFGRDIPFKLTYQPIVQL